MGDGGHLFRDLPRHLEEERFETLLDLPDLRLERIVSTGQATPEGEWLEQEWSEWVIVLLGSAELRFEGEEPLSLGPGDWVLIPAGRRHRVERTDIYRPTVWLALHFEDGSSPT
jgi:cupin 2 domain-containing protein